MVWCHVRDPNTALRAIISSIVGVTAGIVVLFVFIAVAMSVDGDGGGYDAPLFPEAKRGAITPKRSHKAEAERGAIKPKRSEVP